MLYIAYRVGYLASFSIKSRYPRIALVTKRDIYRKFVSGNMKTKDSFYIENISFIEQVKIYHDMQIRNKIYFTALHLS